MSWRDGKGPSGRPSPGGRPAGKNEPGPSGQPSKPTPPNPASPPPSGRAGWRSTAGRPELAQVPGTTRGWWKAKRSAPAEQMSFRVRLALSTLALVLLVGFFVYLVYSRNLQTPLIAFYVSDYSADVLPPNAWAEEDFVHFKERLRNSHVAVANDLGAWGKTNDAALEMLSEELKKVPPGGPDKDMLLVYLSAHGVVNQKGEPCLLLTASSPVEETTWLPVAAILKVLQQAADEKSIKKVLLALDCNRLQTNWGTGLLYNSFFEGLKDLLKKQEQPGLVVLNSTGPGEVAWAAPELGASAFGYYFCEGLSGAAAPPASSYLRSSPKVSLSALETYLRSSVDGWVRERRVGHQLPTVLTTSSIDVTKAGNFQLAFGESSAPDPQIEVDRLKKSHESWSDAQEWQSVQKLWDLHDELKAAKIYCVDPLKWSWFERNLLRLERLMLAGPAYHDECNRLRPKLETWAKSAQLSDKDLVTCNLPLLARKFPASEAKASAPAASQPGAAAAPAPPGATASPAATASAALSGPDAPPVSYSQLASTTWNKLLKASANGRQVADALTTFDQKRAASTSQPKVDVVEIQFLRLLGYVGDPATNLETAITSRNLAEDAATPTDARVQYWLTSEVTQADNARRQAEDLLFVGSPTYFEPNDKPPAKKADANWEEADRGYRKAIDVGAKVSELFAHRDRAFSEAPYLMEWLWSEQLSASDSASSTGKEPVAPTGTDAKGDWATLKAGVTSLQKLSENLDKYILSAGADEGWQSQQLSQDVAAISELCSKRSGESYKDASTAAPDQDNLVAIDRLFAAPFLKASQRKVLRDKQHKFLHDSEKPSLIASETAKDQDDKSPPEQKTVRVLPAELDHPLLTLLGLSNELAGPSPTVEADPKTTNALDPQEQNRLAILRLAKDGYLVRQQLSKAEETINELLASSTKELAKAIRANDVSAAQAREPRSQADRLLRTTAPFYWSQRDPDATRGPDATRKLRDFDLHQLAIWQCERTLDDFWGSANQSPDRGTAAGNAPPYFQRMADECLLSAATILPDGGGLRKVCQARLKERVDASHDFIALSSPERLVVAAADKGQRISVQLAARQAANLPSGMAAVYLQSPGAALPDQNVPLYPGKAGSDASIMRLGLPVDAPGAAAQEALAPMQVVARQSWVSATGSQLLEAVAFYRGHVKTHALNVTPGGVKIVYVPDRPENPSVTVSGVLKQPTDLVLIFDCSASMNEADVPREGTKAKRFDVARETFQTILEELQDSQFHVGVRFYGHRIGFKMPFVPDSAEPSGYKTTLSSYNTAYPVVDKPRHPGADTESVLSVGAFSQLELDNIREKLRKLSPTGETPLYLSIAGALNDLRSDRPQRIVVITDGFNNQYSSTPAKDIETASSLTEKLAKRPKVQVDIVGVGTELKLGDAVKLGEIRKIAADTGGKFYQAENAKDLLDHLMKSLDLGKFEVVEAGSDSGPNPQKVSLKDTWKAPSVPPKPTLYDVKVVDIKSPVSTQVWLEGDEKLELFLEQTDASTSLISHRYTKNEPHRMLKGVIERDPNTTGDKQPQPRPVVGSTSEDFWVAAHVPEVYPQRKVAIFDISVQNQDATKFSRRPAEAWVEITPILTDGTLAEPYRFYDLNFSPQKPAPLLTFKASDFPIGRCQEVQINLFFKIEKTESLPPYSIDQLKAGVAIPEAQIELNADESAAENAPRVVTISEQTPKTEQGAFEPGRVKIEMYPQPVSVKHDFLAGRHEFTVPRNADLSKYQIRVTPRKNLEQGAAHYTLSRLRLPKH